MERIALFNYRCFEHLELALGSKVTLLIGDNASGKTSLVRAISACLNSFFSGFSDENTRFSGLQKSDFREIFAESGLANELPIEVKFKLLGIESSLQLQTPKGRTLQLPLRNITQFAHAVYETLFADAKQVKPLPLIAAFSTSDIHSVRNLNSARFKRYAQKPSFGYYECLQGDGFLDYWTLRLLVLREGSTGELEVNGVIQAIKDMLGAGGCNLIQDVLIRPIQGKVYYQLVDGRLTDTDNLSDGLRRLVNICMDLAFRCMLLNKGIHGAEACAKTEGTVLIDEIDLHLHPSLQSVVVKGLQHAFPGLQFVITSHAPMVMTGIPKDETTKVIHLTYSADNGYVATEISAYGLDASTIIETVLGVVPRSKDVDVDLKVLFDHIDQDQFEAAKEKLRQMRNQFGDSLPDLARAESMLSFLTAV